jgi:hypothetical protein
MRCQHAEICLSRTKIDTRLRSLVASVLTAMPQKRGSSSLEDEPRIYGGVLQARCQLNAPLTGTNFSTITASLKNMGTRAIFTT